MTTAQIPVVTERRAISLFRPDIVKRALIDSVRKLDPRVQVRNPVMFVVEIGAMITTVTWFIQVFGGKALGGNDPLRAAAARRRTRSAQCAPRPSPTCRTAAPRRPQI
jgi:hypothetical protein